MTNKLVHKWLVLRKDDSRVGKGAFWICECQCDKKTIRSLSGVDLRRGKTKCCGCYVSKNKSNVFTQAEDYLIGYTEQGEEFYLDVEDLDKISNYYWYLDDKSYVCSKRFKMEHKLHRLVMDAKDGESVDHINHDTRDNRKCNLRKVTHQQNMFNKLLYKNNKSGHAGVVWNKRDKKWVARININKKQTELGRFKSLEEAIDVRKKAEEVYYGEHRYTQEK